MSNNSRTVATLTEAKKYLENEKALLNEIKDLKSKIKLLEHEVSTLRESERKRPK